MDGLIDGWMDGWMIWWASGLVMMIAACDGDGMI
jgi:hypothetical protein